MRAQGWRPRWITPTNYLRNETLPAEPARCRRGHWTGVRCASVRRTFVMQSTASGKTSDVPHWRYSPPAVVLHWLIALLIATLFGLGWYMMEIERQPGADWYFNLHRSLGLSVAVLVVLRVIWR